MCDSQMKIEDLIFGRQSEEFVRNMLMKHFQRPIHKFKHKYSTFDFYMTDKKGNITDIIEVKSRRNNTKRYDTQLIGVNKIEYAKKQMKMGVIAHLCFNLQDGMFIMKLHPEHEFKQVQLGNFRRGSPPDCLYLIPNFYLSKIDLFDKHPISTPKNLVRPV